MRILQFGKSYPPSLGGIQKVIYDITEGLNKANINCDVLCCNDDNNSTIEDLNGYKVFRVKSLGKIAGTYISPMLMVALKKRMVNYDIIHIHHPEPMATLALWMVRPKQKIVLHWHSDIVKQKIALIFFKPLQNWLINRADKIIATTPKYARESKDLKNIQDKLLYVPIGIDSNELRHNENTVKKIKLKYQDKFIIFSLGRLVYYKGFEYLIESAKYLDDKFIIQIGGKGPLFEKLNEQIQKNNLQDKVKLLGYLSDQDIASFYKACDIFCMSSVERSEAFGIVQIEAMSYGKPVVSTDIPGSGVSWVNKHGESGIIVKPYDGEELAKAFAELNDNTNLYNKYSLNAENRFNKLFTQKVMSEKLIEIYNALMK